MSIVTTESLTDPLPRVKQEFLRLQERRRVIASPPKRWTGSDAGLQLQKNRP